MRRRASSGTGRKGGLIKKRRLMVEFRLLAFEPAALASGADHDDLDRGASQRQILRAAWLLAIGMRCAT
jgi:hypothetical protein